MVVASRIRASLLSPETVLRHHQQAVMRGQSFVVWSWCIPFRAVYPAALRSLSPAFAGAVCSGQAVVPPTGLIPDSRTSRTVYCLVPLSPVLPWAGVSYALSRYLSHDSSPWSIAPFAGSVRLYARTFSRIGCLFSCQNRGSALPSGSLPGPRPRWAIPSSAIRF